MEPICPLHPLEDRLVIRLHDPDTVTPGGIVLPDNAQKVPNQGTVLAVGPGRHDSHGRRVPMNVAQYDTVVVPRYGGTTCEVDGVEFLLLLESDVLAVVGAE